MRLYRGITRKYQPERVVPGLRGDGTDFTDCPYTAMKFAKGSNGFVLVVDMPDDGEPGVSEELWSLDGSGPKRFIVWRRFDNRLIGQIPAKDLRAIVRAKGMRAAPDEVKAGILSRYIERFLSCLSVRQTCRP